MAAGREQLRRRAARQARPDGHAVPKALGERHHIRRHALVLAGEPFAGAAQAGLDLIEHQEPAALVADPAQVLQIAVGGDLDAALAGDRLDEHGHDVLVVLGDLAYRRKVVVRHAVEALHQGFETGLDLAVAGRGKGRERAPVEAALGDDDAGVQHLALVPIEPRKLDRRLVRLGARVAEEGVVHRGEATQALRKLLLQRDLVPVRGVHELARLIADRGRHRGMGVPQAADGHAGQRVQVFVALRIPEPDAFAAHEGDRQAAEGRHQAGMRHFLLKPPKT